MDAIILKDTILIEVPIAAPIIPKGGIRARLRRIFNNVTNSKVLPRSL